MLYNGPRAKHVQKLNRHRTMKIDKRAHCWNTEQKKKKTQHTIIIAEERMLNTCSEFKNIFLTSISPTFISNSSRFKPQQIQIRKMFLKKYGYSKHIPKCNAYPNLTTKTFKTITFHWVAFFYRLKYTNNVRFE